MVFLASLDDSIGVIIRFIALGSIAKVDNFYAEALPAVSSFKAPVAADKVVKFKATHCRRDCRSDAPLTKKAQCQRKGHTWHTHDGIAYVTYKILRLFYSSFVFYFMPYISILLPFLAVLY